MKELKELICLTQLYIYQNFALPPPPKVQTRPAPPVSLPQQKPMVKQEIKPLPLLEKPKQEPAIIQKEPPITTPEDTFDDISKIMQEKFPSYPVLQRPKPIFLFIQPNLPPLEKTFLDTLEKAIQTHLRKPVQRVNAQDISNLKSDCLVLAPRSLKLPPNPLFRLIELEEASFYKESPQEKKLLWTKIQNESTVC